MTPASSKTWAWAEPRAERTSDHSIRAGDPMMRLARYALALVVLLPTAARSDEIDDYVADRMKDAKIPGLSVAVVVLTSVSPPSSSSSTTRLDCESVAVEV